MKIDINNQFSFADDVNFAVFLNSIEVFYFRGRLTILHTKPPNGGMISWLALVLG